MHSPQEGHHQLCVLQRGKSIHHHSRVAQSQRSKHNTCQQITRWLWCHLVPTDRKTVGQECMKGTNWRTSSSKRQSVSETTAGVCFNMFLPKTQADVRALTRPALAYCVSPVFFINRSTEEHKRGADGWEGRDRGGGDGTGGTGDLRGNNQKHTSTSSTGHHPQH